VKIEPMNSPETASAVINGQIDGPGNLVRWSGSASSTLVTSASRMSWRSPVTIG
jgi:hypothetical protein